ncbi:DUF1667 domain-containing protein [Salinispira pacifica]
MAERTIICLRCPRGCEVTATLDNDGHVASVCGNTCKLGIEYATQEVEDPRRVLPTTVRVRGGTMPLVPVWTPTPIPKSRLLDLARATREIVLDAPVEIGQVVIKDWEGLGVDLVASGEVERAR